jgi:hypothetical protein
MNEHFEVAAVKNGEDDLYVEDLRLGRQKQVRRVSHSKNWEPKETIFPVTPFTFKGSMVEGYFDLVTLCKVRLRSCFIYQYVNGIAKGYCLAVEVYQ